MVKDAVKINRLVTDNKRVPFFANEAHDEVVKFIKVLENVKKNWVWKSIKQILVSDWCT